MFEVNFQMLVEFVEVECASQHQIYTRQEQHRSSADGIAHLDSLIRSSGNEACRVETERDFGDSYLVQETYIADDGGYVSLATAAWSHAAREMKALYLWYTHMSQERTDPDEAENQAMLIRLIKIRLYLWM
jgi:hypothetical protein